MRGRGKPKLRKLRRDGDVDGLRQAAVYKDVLVARDGQLIDKGVPIRVAALEALSKPEGEGILPALAAALGDEAPEVRRAAVSALGKDGTSEAVGALVDFLATELASEDAEVRQSALEFVCASEWPGFTERWARRVRDLRNEPLGEADREIFERLRATDGGAQPEQRVFEVMAPSIGSDAGPGNDAACEAVLRWCTPTRFDGLASMLTEDRVSLELIRLAGLTGDQALLDPLTELLERPDPEVRREAANALGALCDTRAVLPLLKATSDSELRVRQGAIAAFDSLGGAGVTAAMSLLMLEMNRGLASAEIEQRSALDLEPDAFNGAEGASPEPLAADAPTPQPPTPVFFPHGDGAIRRWSRMFRTGRVRP